MEAFGGRYKPPEGQKLNPDDVANYSRLIEDIKSFIRSALKERDKKVVEMLEGMKQEKPKGKCLNAENHLFGSCFECKKIEGHNAALDAAITKLKGEDC